MALLWLVLFIGLLSLRKYQFSDPKFIGEKMLGLWVDSLITKFKTRKK